ncbi:DNA-binding protein [Ferruginivarius sediminum]|uniref:DNA-binding protein n=2 Tax=Ferruginivarius sediminum TaxID=2661937 RepID=A0A369TIJ4_9PROT|nr:DNA-binding protein [Ferruginivarius sediminum]
MRRQVPGMNLLTVAEVAAELRCSTRTVYNRVNDGELTAIKRPGSPWLIPRQSLDDYVSRYLCPANPSTGSNPSSTSSQAGRSGTSSGRTPAPGAADASLRAFRASRAAREIRSGRR